MFKIGDYVVHSGHGVCIIVEKKYNENFNKYFFNLKTVSNNLSIMVPEEKLESLLRPILLKNSCLEIIESSINKNISYSKDNKIRKNEFQKLASSNSLDDTLYLLKCIYHLIEERKKEKKIIGSVDSNFFQQANKKAIDEISIVLEMSKLETENFLYERLKSQ